MAHSSFDSTVGLRPGCGLGLHLAPPALVLSLAPAIIAALVSPTNISSCGLPFSSTSTSTKAASLHPQLDFVSWTSGRGISVKVSFCFVLLIHFHFHSVPCYDLPDFCLPDFCFPSYSLVPHLFLILLIVVPCVFKPWVLSVPCPVSFEFTWL